MEKRPPYSSLKAYVGYDTALPTIEDVNPADLQQLIGKQLHDAKLKPEPELHLFPKPGEFPPDIPPEPDFSGTKEEALEKFKKALENIGRPHEGQYWSDPEKTLVIGSSSATLSVTNEMQNLLPKSERKTCVTDQLQENPKATKVFTALHETSHYVADKLGLDNSVYEAISEKAHIKKPKNGDSVLAHTNLTTNMHERIADVSAALYMRSNFGPAVDVSDIIAMHRDWRNAGKNELRHNTVSSLNHVLAMPDQDIPRHMTIVQTTLMAAELIKAQPGLVNELQTLDWYGLHTPAASKASQADARKVCLPKHLGKSDFQ